MPDVFRAAHEDETEELYESGVGDGRGYVSDDAYIGRPDIGPRIPEAARTSIEPQEAYTKALKERFLNQRAQMHTNPGAASVARLDDEHPITLPEGNNKAYAEWSRLLKTFAPLPAQVRAMNLDTVHRLLSLVQRMHIKREQAVCSVTSAWVWSLLARLDDVGTMNNDEVYAIREFGKKAVLVQLSFDDAAAARQLEEGDETEKTTSVNSTTDTLERDVGKPPVSIEDGEPARENTLATLDMIISIVGEVFGQRDLLEFRRKWEAEEAQPAQKEV